MDKESDLYLVDEQTIHWKTALPMTVGHEFSGKEVRSIRLGDNIVDELHILGLKKVLSAS